MSVKIILAQDFRRQPIHYQQDIESKVREILMDIHNNGDVAIKQWSKMIDGRPAEIIKLKPFAEYNLEPELAKAIKTAHRRIENFCRFQMKDLKSDTFNDGLGDFGYIYQPIERIGAYIPGGRFPLISTALMTLTPAKIAACPVRVGCSPSTHPALLAAASLAGATDFLCVGGAQAIGALTYGYEVIAAVDMIVGPGNAYVTAAKSQVQHQTKIDSLAGPSELLIYAEEFQNPDWVMLDALAQAEHDPNAVSIILSTSRKLLETLYNNTRLSSQITRLVENQQIIFVQAENKAQAIRLINDYAPEHLLIGDTDMDISLFTNYGSLFIGENSAVAFGDYCAGPNHTLPTNGSSKNSSGLSVHQFFKVLSTQKVNNKGRVELAKTASILAKAEGLAFHQQSAEARSLV